MTEKKTKKPAVRKAKAADPAASTPTEGKADAGLSVVKAFRVAPAIAADLDAEIQKFGGGASEYFRARIAENKMVVQGVKTRYKESPVTLETLRLLSKQSNNLNQIAKALNESRMSGGISAADCLLALQELQEISRQSVALVPSKIGAESGGD